MVRSRWCLAGIALALTLTGCSGARTSPPPSPSPSPYEDASAYLDTTPTQAPDLTHPYVRGKVVMVWSRKDAGSPRVPGSSPGTIVTGWQWPRTDLYPTRPQDVGTIVVLYCEAVPSGTYWNGMTAYDASCGVSVIDKAANLIVGGKGFRAAAPNSISCPTSGTCPPSTGAASWPNDDIVKFVEGLPRK